MSLNVHNNPLKLQIKLNLSRIYIKKTILLQNSSIYLSFSMYNFQVNFSSQILI